MNISTTDHEYLNELEPRVYEIRDEIKAATEHLKSLQEERRTLALTFHDIGGYTAYGIAKMFEVSETSVGRWIRDASD